MEIAYLEGVCVLGNDCHVAGLLATTRRVQLGSATSLPDPCFAMAPGWPHYTGNNINAILFAPVRTHGSYVTPLSGFSGLVSRLM